MKSRSLDRWIDRQLAERPLRANSLIVTIYGDMIAPRGGTVWLGGLIRLVGRLGLNPRMVRTSVFRLSREQWLASEQIGRRSFYTLAPAGRRRFDHAFRRIYEDARPAWNGDWRIVLTSADGLPSSVRDALRKELLWEGYGAIAPGVLAHPSSRSDDLLEILRTTGALDKVVVLTAQTLGALSSRPLRDIVDQCWNLSSVAVGYDEFIARFRPVVRTLRESTRLAPEQCFVVRTLLMHEFRRAQLRDPMLPSVLLPAGWPGDVARDLCRDIYRLCRDRAEAHLTAMLETADGPLPPAQPGFQSRFGCAETGAEAAA